MTSALGLALSALVWLAPPPVLPLPSRSGPEGPPRPLGAAPHVGAEPKPTGYAQVRAQNRALLEGPFPRGGLERGVSEGTLLLSEDAAVRGLALSRIREAGARTVRIPVDWRGTVSGEPGPGFDAADPASPSYHFALIDAAVRSAVAAGLTPLLVVSHAPAFAEAEPRWGYAYPGSWDPSPQALGAFATALALRYDGGFPDPLDPARTLPRVRLFQAWNEPNLARYLEPQWVAQEGRWSAFSPIIYRELLNGFYAGVESVEPGDTVVAAGMAPNGDPTGVGRMAPVQFLRSLLCLTARGAASPSGCPDPPHFDVLDFHPLSVGNPDVPAPSSLEVSVSDAAKITRLLAQAERARTALPAGGKRVWVTELQLGKRAPVPAGRSPERAGAVDLEGPAPPVGGRGQPRGLAVPRRSLPGRAARHPHRRHRRGVPPRRSLQRGSRRPARCRDTQAVLERLHAPVRSPASGRRAGAGVGAADASASAGSAATRRAPSAVANVCPSASGRQWCAQRARRRARRCAAAPSGRCPDLLGRARSGASQSVVRDQSLIYLSIS